MPVRSTQCQNRAVRSTQGGRGVSPSSLEKLRSFPPNIDTQAYVRKDYIRYNLNWILVYANKQNTGQNIKLFECFSSFFFNKIFAMNLSVKSFTTIHHYEALL